ncbi:hypothetical protein [Bradyrhizobium sp. CB1015]|uniref:hypothetical protein n=1 Tax=Bradyrhizobium sp. CB1015 TaxID=2976822 RepID=UPI0021AAFD6B|nr:hypothetical protein [Bradyrhizobium sp. CB1015]UWU95729.1 hypothetical protein N2604_18385 [Bradyrhizobium sp. CB1015]
MGYHSDTHIAASVLSIARKVFYSEGPIELRSTLLDDLIATPVDILDVCRHIGRRLDIEIARDEVLAAIRSDPQDCTLGWLVELCRQRQSPNRLGS